MVREKVFKALKVLFIRVFKTMAETALAIIGSSVIFSEVNWLYLFSATALSGIATILFNIKNISESEFK